MAGGTDYCNPEALLAFAESAEGIGESIDGFLGRLDSARVARDAFGRMPFIGQQIYDAYDEHVDESKLGVTEAKSALQGASAGAAMSAAEWLQAEAAVIEGVSEVGEPG
jgi:hypothetical protein